MGDTTYTIGWADAETLEKTLTGGAALLAQLAKLKQALSKGRRPKRDLKKLGEEIDELQANLKIVVDLLTKSSVMRRKLVEAVGSGFATLGKAVEVFGIANLPKVTKIVLSHEARLKALEASIVAGSSKPTRKRKRK